MDPVYVKPSEWDLKVVEDDLGHYVQLTKLIKATPVLRIVGETLVLISGEPFVRAARNMVPPLGEVICLIENDEESVRLLGLDIITASQLIDQNPPNEVYDAVEMLAFSRPLKDREKSTVEEHIRAFFDDVTANPSVYGGNYSSLSGFEWAGENRTVHWTWTRNDQFGRHTFMFMELLRTLDNGVAPVSSWNGLAPQSLL